MYCLELSQPNKVALILESCNQMSFSNYLGKEEHHSFDFTKVGKNVRVKGKTVDESVNVTVRAPL